jgi:hypothetical protein
LIAPPLVTADDPDWIAYNSGDENLFLNSAGELVRRFCGWHIWPSLTATVGKLRVGASGIVMLPSLFVTDVFEVKIGDSVLEPDDYMWFREGYIRVPVEAAWSGGYYGYGAGGYLPGPTPGKFGQVGMTHGYDAVPLELKSVIFELAASAAEIPAGNVKDIQTPGFRLQLSQAGGLTLNSGQMDRLSGFKLSWTR